MDKDYVIEWCEKVEKFGKPALECTNKDEGKFTIYKFDKQEKEFPGFDQIMNGHTVRGNMYTSDKGYKTLYAPRPTTSPKAGAFKQIQIEKTMDKKNESISRFQDSKEFSIKVSSTFRAAQETAVAEWNDQRRLSTTGPTLEQLFDKWREFYWMHFDVAENQYPPFNS